MNIFCYIYIHISSREKSEDRHHPILYIIMGVLHFNALTASFSGALQLVSFTFCGRNALYGDSTNSNCIFQFKLPVMYLYIAYVNLLQSYTFKC